MVFRVYSCQRTVTRQMQRDVLIASIDMAHDLCYCIVFAVTGAAGDEPSIYLKCMGKDFVSRSFRVRQI